MQTAALDAAGCEAVFVDRASGTTTKRPELARLLDKVAKGDTVTVWKLDRFARSLSDLLKLARELDERGVDLVSLNDPIDTTSAYGRFTFQLLGALAELEAGIVRERTAAGLTAAKARGQRLGRRPKLSAAQIDHARRLIEGGEGVSGVARTLGVHRSTLYEALKEQRE